MTSTLLALSQLMAPAATAPASPAEGEATPEGEGTALPQMVVQADGTKKLYKPENLTTGKYTVPLRDVPQTVTVIPKEVMKEQGVNNLRDVLKNVPGISIQAGEGGAPPGDNLAIRGFTARTDMFVDGVRDFGGYSRDPFNIEQVEVTKGPSSTNAGRGSTGGAINLSTKMPQLEKAYGVMLGGGTDSFTRATVDLNQELPGLKGTAVRMNGLYHKQDTPGRDHVEQERWGVAPSITFGLGSETRFTLSYFHLEQNNVPDYGLPWVPRDDSRTTTDNENTTGLPSGRVKVDDSNWYGLLGRDHEDNVTDIVTGIFEHDFNENLKLKNTLRYGQNTIDLSVTAPRFYSSPRNPLPPGTDPTAVRRTDWKNRDQEDSIISNQTELRYDFLTGKVKHEMIAALEVSHEKSENRLREDRNLALVPDADLENPDANAPYVSDIIYNDGLNRTKADSVGISLFDTAKINEQWMVSGGLRWDSFDVDYHSVAPTVATVPGAVTDLSRKDEMLSYRAAVTYKPVENGSIYLGYGTSFNPSAEGLALSDSATSSSYFDIDPEENRTVELGTKWDLLDDKLLLTGAIFRTEKTNARTEDPTDPLDIIALDGEQRVQGFELGFNGLLTDKWRLIGGYTYLDSEITESKNTDEEGQEISNTPANSFSLWSVYDLPKGFQIGLGTQYVGSRYNRSDKETRQQAPSYTLIDGMIGYQLNENVSFRLNAYNLMDKDYIDRVGGGHYVPGQGRSVVLTADIKF
jgi:catecholate siderophore receptor